jgi:glucokinase
MIDTCPGSLFVVVDVGGTTLRIGYVDRVTGRLLSVHREPVEGIAVDPRASVAATQRRVVAQLRRRIGEFVAGAGGSVSAVGVAFAGPVDNTGAVTDAPTIWGPRGAPVRLGPLLALSTGLPVEVVNDVTAAGWRYLPQEKEDFCIVTVSSGIGNKVFRNGEVLLHPAGLGGEIGHVRVDPSPSAPQCDCGGFGHLGGIASGRGVLAGVRRRAATDPTAYRRSALHDLSAGDPSAITDRAVVAAIRAGDLLALDVLREGLSHLAVVLSTIYVAIGVRRFVIVGGFALAVGDLYAHLLSDRLCHVGCFGIASDAIASMLRLGEPDDDHSLIGCGRYLAHLADAK